MKLIIDVPEYEYQHIKEIYEKNDTVEATYSYIYHGIPLEPCDDAISRQAVIDAIYDNDYKKDMRRAIEDLPFVNPQEPRMGHCKDCKYFEYDSVAKVDGIPLILAHEICKRWGDGCKTSEDGYCFLFEPQENEET